MSQAGWHQGCRLEQGAPNSQGTSDKPANTQKHSGQCGDGDRVVQVWFMLPQPARGLFVSLLVRKYTTYTSQHVCPNSFTRSQRTEGRCLPEQETGLSHWHKGDTTRHTVRALSLSQPQTTVSRVIMPAKLLLLRLMLLLACRSQRDTTGGSTL